MFQTPEADEISLEIDGRTFRYWTEIELNFTLDGFASVSFAAPFEPEHREFRDTFRPFSFREVKVLRAGKLLFTGTMVDVVPQVEPSRRVVAVTAYSKAAVLGDVTAPASAYPLEFSGLSLTQISAKLLEPFGLSASVPLGLSEGSKFPKLRLDPEDRILGFLADLAKQRGLVLSSDETGNVVYRQSHSGPSIPVAKLNESTSPVTSVTATFSPQDYHSDITVISKPKTGRDGGKYTATNTFLTGVVRPLVVKAEDTDAGDLALITRAKLGRMLGNVCSYDVELDTWFDPLGNLWTPDTRVLLTAEGAMVYSESELVIRSVRLTKDSERRTSAGLNLVLPGIFSGELPETLPWVDSL